MAYSRNNENDAYLGMLWGALQHPVVGTAKNKRHLNHPIRPPYQYPTREQCTY